MLLRPKDRARFGSVVVGGVHVWVGGRERERERERGVGVCVCVCVREREREE